MEEAWKPFGPDPRIEASSHGRLRRLLTTGAVRIVRHAEEDERGYCKVRTAVGTVRYHQIVCIAWHGPKPFPKAEVLHTNGNPRDCTPVNLRWGTRQDNIDDSIRHGTHSRGERHGCARLTADGVRAIRRRIAAGESQTAVADFYNVSRATVQRILNGVTWRHLDSCCVGEQSMV